MEKLNNQEKIPKIIHYFWFGKTELPQITQKCINSWKKYCPDYKIIKWDEDNFNINICHYTEEAYKAKKYAFVSDYARFYILNKFGGVYLDTDVELLKPIDHIVEKGPFFALESEYYDSVNPGVGMATYANNEFYSKILSQYNREHFISSYGTYRLTPVGKRVAKLLKNDGLTYKSGIQCIDGIFLYPKEYFCPLDYNTGIMKKTKNTVAVHLFASSWMSPYERKVHLIGQKLNARFKNNIGSKIELFLKAPYLINKKIKKIGLVKTLNFYFTKKFKER